MKREDAKALRSGGAAYQRRLTNRYLHTHVPCYSVRMSDGFAALIPARRCPDELLLRSSEWNVRDAVNRHSYLGTKSNDVDCADERNMIMDAVVCAACSGVSSRCPALIGACTAIPGRMDPDRRIESGQRHAEKTYIIESDSSAAGS